MLILLVMTTYTLSLSYYFTSAQDIQDPRAPVIFPSSDIRKFAVSEGCDPRYPWWSPVFPGYDSASRPINLFGQSPFRSLTCEFSVKVPISSIPHGDPNIGAKSKKQVVKSVSKAARVSSSTQTPLSAFKSPRTGCFILRWPSSISGFRPSQIARQNARRDLHIMLRSRRQELLSHARENPQLTYLYSLPYFENLPTASTSKFFTS